MRQNCAAPANGWGGGDSVGAAHGDRRHLPAADRRHRHLLLPSRYRPQPLTVTDTAIAAVTAVSMVARGAVHSAAGRGARPVGKDNRDHALADTVVRTRSPAGGVQRCSRGTRRQHAIRHDTDMEAELLLVEHYISDSRSRQMKPGRRVAGAGPTGGPRVTRVKSRLERGCRNDGITMTTQLLRLCPRAERRQPIRG